MEHLNGKSQLPIINLKYDHIILVLYYNTFYYTTTKISYILILKFLLLIFKCACYHSQLKNRNKCTQRVVNDNKNNDNDDFVDRF